MKKKKSTAVRPDLLARRVARRSGQSEARSRKFIEAFFEEIGSGLEGEVRISISRFGIFKKKFSEKRKGYNPQTKKKITVKAHNRIAFTPARALAAVVNRKYRHLKPNVIDEMKIITGIAKPAGKIVLTPTRKKARRRAIISLGILAVLALLFFSLLLIIPAMFRRSDAQVVQFIRNLNAMMGMKNMSDSLAHKLPQRINVKLLGQYIFRTKKALTLNRKIVKTHIIRRGESIYSVAKKYYGNKFLWPDLYYLNKNRFEDPDLVRVGEKIHIYKKLGDPKNLTPPQKRILAQAYITMYRVSRALAEKEIASGRRSKVRKGKKRIRESRWTLHTALRYDHDILDTYEDAIYPEDRKIVDSYIDRFGYGDGTKRSFWDIF